MNLLPASCSWLFGSFYLCNWFLYHLRMWTLLSASAIVPDRPRIFRRLWGLEFILKFKFVLNILFAAQSLRIRQWFFCWSRNLLLLRTATTVATKEITFTQIIIFQMGIPYNICYKGNNYMSKFLILFCVSRQLVTTYWYIKASLADVSFCGLKHL